MYERIMILIMALIVDLVFGDPHNWFHPVMAMGRGIEWLEKFLRRSLHISEDPEADRGKKQFAGAILVVLMLVIFTVIPLIIHNIATLFGENELVEYNAVLSSGDNVFGSDGETRYFSDCVSKMMKNKLETELAQLNEVLGAETDTEKRKEIIGAIAKITAKLAKY